MVCAEFLKAGEERLRRGADGQPARQRLSAGEQAQIDFLIGAIESEDQGKAWSGFGIHGSCFVFSAATPRATLTLRRQYRRVLSHKKRAASERVVQGSKPARQTRR
jgi:hypothetical protein